MFQCIGVLKIMSEGCHQTSAVSDPLQQRVNINHEMPSFNMINGREDLTRSYGRFTETTVFSPSRPEHAGPLYKRRALYSDGTTQFCSSNCGLKPPVWPRGSLQTCKTAEMDLDLAVSFSCYLTELRRMWMSCPVEKFHGPNRMIMIDEGERKFQEA